MVSGSDGGALGVAERYPIPAAPINAAVGGLWARLSDRTW